MNAIIKPIALAIGVSLLSLSACSQPVKSTLEASLQAEQGDAVAAVLIFAEWCPSCKVLDPKVEAARASEDWSGVSFVLLDFTDKNSARLFEAADAAGVGPAIRKELAGGVRTGQLILVDLEDQVAVDRLTKDLSVEAISERIRTALPAL